MAFWCGITHVEVACKITLKNITRYQQIITHRNFKVQARRLAQEDEFKLELRQMEEDKEGEEDYEAMLRREAEKMSVRGFEPKVCNFTIVKAIRTEIFRSVIGKKIIE